MKLNINTKKMASIIIAGGVALNASMLEVKSPTTEDAIAIIIANDVNNMFGKKIIKDTDVDVYYNKVANSVSYSTPYLPSKAKQLVDQRIYGDIINLIGEPNYDELTLVNEYPVYTTTTITTQNNIEIDDKTRKVAIENQDVIVFCGYKKYYIDPSAEEYFKKKYYPSDETFIYGYEQYYIDSSAKEHFKEKYYFSKVKQR